MYKCVSEWRRCRYFFCNTLFSRIIMCSQCDNWDPPPVTPASLYCTVKHLPVSHCIKCFSQAKLQHKYALKCVYCCRLPWLSPVLQPLAHLIFWVLYIICSLRRWITSRLLCCISMQLLFFGGGSHPSMSNSSKVWVFTLSYMVSDACSIHTSRQCHVHTMHRVET